MKPWLNRTIYNLFVLCIITLLLNSLYLWYSSSRLGQQQQQQDESKYNILHPSLRINRNLNVDDTDVVYPFLHNFDPDNESKHPTPNAFKKEAWAMSTPMRKRSVCVVTTEIEGPVLGGGIGTAYTALSQRLQSDGHHVTVLLVNSVKKLTPEHWIDLYEQRGIKLVILDLQKKKYNDGSVSVKGKFKQGASILDGLVDIPNISLLDEVAGCTGPCLRAYKTYEWLRDREELFDIVHFHDNGGMGYFSTLARHQGTAFAETIFVVGGHGPHLWERTANSANLDDGKHFEVDYLERRTIEMADWLVSPSNYMLNWMRRNGWILPRNSYVHQNLLPVAQQGETNLDVNVVRSFDEIIFFGRLESRKGLDIFIKAIERLRDRIKRDNIIITFLGANTKLPDVNQLADTFIIQKCARLDLVCRVMVGKSHTEAIQYLTFEREKKLIVIPSPIDNSPNTVLECLTHHLAFIASRVGGIPELIHPEDRTRTLFQPRPSSLTKKLNTAMNEGAKPARMAIDEWTRHKIWSNWHSYVRTSTEIEPANSRVTLDKLSVVVVYDRTNEREFMLQLESLDRQLTVDELLHFRVELIVIISSACIFDPTERIYILTSTLESGVLQAPKFATVSEYLLEQWFQPWNSRAIHDIVTGEYILFIDRFDWMADDALASIISVERNTNADLISSSVQYNNASAFTNITAVYIGCLGMNGIMYNCYGANNVFMKRAVLESISRRYLPDDIEDEIDYGGTWELYAEATNKGFSLETIPKNLFFTNKGDIDSSSTYNQELRVMKYFESILPPSMGLAPLATRHFLISKNLYLNEIVSVTQISNKLQQQCAKKEAIKELSSDIIALEDMEGSQIGPMMESRDHIGLLFVRGHEKSGTSWLKKVLNLHPRIMLAQQEFHFHLLEDALDKFTESHWAAAKEPYLTHTRKWYRSFVRNLVMSGVSPATAPLINWVGEKTPSPLSPLISGARYIVIVRDGRDVLVSLFWHYVRLGGFENWCGPGGSKYLVDPNYVANYNADINYFKKNPSQLLEKEQCFRHIARSWAQRVTEDMQVTQDLENMRDAPTRVHLVRYEELHRRPEESRAEMYTFLDLDPEEAEPLSVDDKTSPGGFQEDSKAKFFRKGEIGDWKNYFTKTNKQWFKEEAGHALLRLGYEIDSNW